ncbi:E3 ubiquitin-protein ligase siah-1-like isoform X2 [Galleria mellonella]|nr:E3 ubiquitin-protein ligase siah-1-like isoform X2 [Galleria mellonella]
MASAAIDLPECPVCMETMLGPIFQCQSGHSLCIKCTTSLCPPICPLCRQPMTQMRNWQLEEMISKAKVPCPNKTFGCVYMMESNDVQDHLKECIFREMDCPLGLVFGRCSWHGKLKEMMDHFKERHPLNCNVNTDTDVELNNINVKEDDRYMYLISQGKLLFIITMKIDTLQNMVYWTIQHIGSKAVAHQHVYEIHVTSKQDTRRKIVFMEHCFNDALKADEVFRIGKCGIMPLNMFGHFIKDNKMSFRFFIKRIPSSCNKEKKSKGDTNAKPQNDNSGPKGFGQKGAGNKGPGPKGPGPKPQGPKKPFKQHTNN